MPEPLRTLTTPAGTVHVFASPADACEAAASRIAHIVQEATASRGRAVLGLATGGTPIPVYRRLVQLHQQGRLSWNNVSSYNLDEYYPIAPTDPNSYRSYMQQHLFDHVRPDANRAHVLDGTVPEAFANEHAADFDRWIAAEGGLDLQLLGIGRNGHIGFNEPCDLAPDEAAALPSRLAPLHPVTLADAVRDFGGEEQAVPKRALTVGTATILAARSILLLAIGPHKAEIVARSLRGVISSSCPASLLQRVSDRVTWLLDKAAAGRLG